MDIDSNYRTPGRADTSLPDFDDPSRETERLQSQCWADFRREADEHLLGEVRATALRGRTRPDLSILIEQRHASETGAWYGRWRDPRDPLPDGVVEPSPSPGGAEKPKDVWHPVVRQIRLTGADSAASLALQLKAVAADKTCDGYVLQIVADGTGQSQVGPAEVLEQALGAPSSPR